MHLSFEEKQLIYTTLSYIKMSYDGLVAADGDYDFEVYDALSALHKRFEDQVRQEAKP